MELKRDELQEQIHALYAQEHAELGDSGTQEHLQRGAELCEKYDLTEIIREGGVLVFPHAGVADCGYQIAACVHACLDSGAKRVIVVSVLHAFTDEMEQARRRVAADNSHLDAEELRGIQGPGIDGRNEWTGDHALISWRHFWEAAVKARGLTDDEIPGVIERYPYLAGGHPETLDGIEDLKALADDDDTVIVSTADAFHHGIGYGDAPEDSFEPDETGLAKAKAMLQVGIALLEKGDYWGYNGHCVVAKSDARDAGQVFRYLRGDMTGQVVDMSYTDSTALYNQPSPTWVAGALMTWRRSAS